MLFAEEFFVKLLRHLDRKPYVCGCYFPGTFEFGDSIPFFSRIDAGDAFPFGEDIPHKG